MHRPLHRYRHAVAALALVSAAACTSTTEILEVTDPDIINPSDVQSAAGANAVRLGAIARFNAATSGAESLFMLGGLFSDEWINGDSFIARQEIDQRVVTAENSFLLDATRTLHRARSAAGQAVDLLRRFSPNAPGWQGAEMYLIEGYVENLMAEHFCSGLVFSGLVDGVEQYGSPISTAAALDRALAHVDSGLAALGNGTTTNDARVRNALALTRGRILLNQNKTAEAATAVTSVPTSFRYEMFHSQATNDNVFWNFNNNARRYSVAPGEGTNGVNFAAANDPRVPVCQGGDTRCASIGVTSRSRDDLAQPINVQMLWAGREATVAIMTGLEARLIEAEAQLKAGNSAASLATLNALRAGSNLAPLTDAGSANARLDQLFRERAFWQFGRGFRTGDLRRLIRQYGRAANTVFPTGAWQPGMKSGNYGSDVTLPLPQAEKNNPNVANTQGCIDRNA